MQSRPRARRLLALIAALTAIVLIAAGCGGRTSQTGQSQKTINIGTTDWDESVAVSDLYAVLLEKQGYKVNVQTLDAGPLYAGLAQGSIDMFPDAWLPSTHGDYWKQYQGKLQDLGIWYNEATLNLAVPAYMTDINSVSDLAGKQGMFNGTITGIDPGAGETRIVRNDVMPQYGLAGPYNLQTSSSTAMLVALQKAYDAKQPIVVTLWHPHWAYAKYQLKDLTDPKGALGKAEQLHFTARNNFQQDFPDLTQMISKFKLDDKTLASLENAVSNAPKGQEKQAAQQWADQNPQVIASFAPAK
jgi:glycine betaine/proline transport system substrate-binding protein